MEQRNFFDDLNPVEIEDALKQQREAKAQGEKIDYLIHRVFSQNEDGRELLTIWRESLILNPVVIEGCDPASAGIKEGMNRFIRGIILTINRVERG